MLTSSGYCESVSIRRYFHRAETQLFHSYLHQEVWQEENVTLSTDDSAVAHEYPFHSGCFYSANLPMNAIDPNISRHRAYS